MKYHGLRRSCQSIQHLPKCRLNRLQLVASCMQYGCHRQGRQAHRHYRPLGQSSDSFFDPVQPRPRVGNHFAAYFTWGSPRQSWIQISPFQHDQCGIQRLPCAFERTSEVPVESRSDFNAARRQAQPQMSLDRGLHMQRCESARQKHTEPRALLRGISDLKCFDEFHSDQPQKTVLTISQHPGPNSCCRGLFRSSADLELEERGTSETPNTILMMFESASTIFSTGDKVQRLR